MMNRPVTKAREALIGDQADDKGRKENHCISDPHAIPRDVNVGSHCCRGLDFDSFSTVPRFTIRLA